MITLVPMLDLDRKNNDTSLMLDLMRAVAAQMVCVGHAISFFKSDIRPSESPVMQNVGVLLFFLISGLVIAATLSKRVHDEQYGFLRFFIDRFARIYAGLLPALLLVAVIDGVMLVTTGYPTIASYYDVKTFAANLLMLQGYWGVFENTLRFPTFGSASPLWTLAIEWHIYMFVGAIFFALVRRRNLLPLACVAAFSGQIALHYVTGSFQEEPNVGRGLFLLWSIGFCLFFLGRRLNRLVCLAALVASVWAYGLITRPYQEYDFKGYVLLAVAFGSLLCLTQSTRVLAPAGRVIGLFANYSFSLYLIHHSLMLMVYVLRPERGWPEFIGAILAANLIAALLAAVGENHHKTLAAWLYRRVKPVQAAQAAS